MPAVPGNRIADKEIEKPGTHQQQPSFMCPGDQYLGAAHIFDIADHARESTVLDQAEDEPDPRRQCRPECERHGYVQKLMVAGHAERASALAVLNRDREEARPDHLGSYRRHPGTKRDRTKPKR